MFGRLGRVMARRRWWVVVGALAFLVFAGVWGTGVFGSLTGGSGFDDPGSESVRADRILDGPLGRYGNDVVVLYRDPARTVDDPAYAGAVQRAVGALPPGSADRAESYWSTRDPAFVSRDRHSTYVVLQLAARDDDRQHVERYKQLRPVLRAPGLEVRFGGLVPMTEQVNRESLGDVARAEMISLPVLAVLLVLVFRGAVAAGLTLAVGVSVALGGLVLLRVVAFFEDISTMAVNVVTILALALAIDYALLVVGRFRDELTRAPDVETAVERTMATAGRTVAFSGLTAAAALACTLVFPSRFMHSMGWAGVTVALTAVAGSLTLLPALLGFAGHRVNGLRVPLGRRRAAGEGHRWYRLAHAVMRRPLAVTLGVVALLLALGAPFATANWARPGDWVQPADGEARSVTRALAAGFPRDPAKIVTAVVEADAPPGPDALGEYARRLDAVPHVTGARVTGVHGAQARVTLGYAIDPMSPEARTMVERLRAEPPPPGARALFTGMPASRVDIVDMVFERLPWMVLLAAVVSFAVMFLAFGSVVLPLQAVALNLLSLSAALGVIRLVFQDGWFSGVLGFVPIGAVDVNFPLLVVVIAFGVAMDYEVFLVARIREEHRRTGDLREAVAVGIQRTAGVVTGAGLLLAVVVGGFVLSEITVMKMIGVGVVLAILVDLTLVRGLLLPATFALLGERIWWAPGRRAVAPPRPSMIEERAGTP
ncbi:MMPL family transporter [Actinomadura kijaniata]|uniref:MMPL family transporter n=1 Tax=Actinomadura kijaniata TaxID=46161 RepID=UPI003F1BD093